MSGQGNYPRTNWDRTEPGPVLSGFGVQRFGFDAQLPPPDPQTRRFGKQPPTPQGTKPSTVLFVLAALSVVGAIIAFIAAGAEQASAQRDRTTGNMVRSLDNGLNGANNEMLGPVATNFVPGIALLIIAALLATWGVILAAGARGSAR